MNEIKFQILDYAVMGWHALRNTSKKLGVPAKGNRLEIIEKLKNKFRNQKVFIAAYEKQVNLLLNIIHFVELVEKRKEKTRMEVIKNYFSTRKI